VEEYISQGKDQDLVDPDPNQIFTKRKLNKQGKLLDDTTTASSLQLTLKYPEDGWTTSLSKMPFFTRAEIDNHIRESGKRIGSKDNHSVPTSWRKGKTFLEDEYLKDIECSSDDHHFYFRCQCYHSFKKNDKPHSLKLTLSMITGEVLHSVCSCVAGKTGYCNHSLCLMLKLCKFSMYRSKTTVDLSSESDENPQLACTSSLQNWHKRGRGETIVPQPVMDIIVKKTRLDDAEHDSGLKCSLYEARQNPQLDGSGVNEFMQTLRHINPKMGLAQLVSSKSDGLTDTKYGKSPKGSYLSYQVSHTESNFIVDMDISSIDRKEQSMPIEAFPRFPLTVLEENDKHDLTDLQQEFVMSLSVSEDKINEIERNTRGQANCDLWKAERKYRFTASRFSLISNRKRNHDTFSSNLMHPKDVKSIYTAHGIKYEGTAIHEYMRYMNSIKKPIEVYKCGFVVYKKEPILGCSPDGKVIDSGATEPFGIIEVKCPQTKFMVTPQDACSDANFFCTFTNGHCRLKTSHQYYAQVQGQMGITGAKWCDFIVYTKKGMSIERIPFNPEYWQDLESKLIAYYYNHFISFAVDDFLKSSTVSAQ